MDRFCPYRKVLSIAISDSQLGQIWTYVDVHPLSSNEHQETQVACKKSTNGCCYSRTLPTRCIDFSQKWFMRIFLGKPYALNNHKIATMVGYCRTNGTIVISYALVVRAPAFVVSSRCCVYRYTYVCVNYIELYLNMHHILSNISLRFDSI